MIKKINIMVFTTLFIITSLGLSFAADQEGNERKGRYLYRKVYKACNARGEVEVAKPLLNPDDRSQVEWKGIFDNKQFNDFQCQEEWNGLSDKDLLHIFTYLHAHASDSGSPVKCK